MTNRINTYFAVLLITLAGAGACMLIVHIAYANVSTVFFSGGADYAMFQDVLLK